MRNGRSGRKSIWLKKDEGGGFVIFLANLLSLALLRFLKASIIPEQDVQ